MPTYSYYLQAIARLIRANVHDLRSFGRLGSRAASVLWHQGVRGLARRVRYWDELLQSARSRSPPRSSRPGTNFDYRIVQASPIDPDSDVVIFVTYSPSGSLSELQRYQLQCFKDAGYAVVLIVNSDLLGDPGANEAGVQIVRENRGFDFGGWGLALRVIPDLEKVRSVTFANDSIVPVGDRHAIASQKQRIQANHSDAVFLTKNAEVQPHLQSYFFTIKRSEKLQQALYYLRKIPLYSDKNTLIHDVELKLAGQLGALGLSVDYLYKIPEIEKSGRNPTIHHWRELATVGFPFFKAQLISARLLSIDDGELGQLMGEDLHRMLKEHLELRSALPSPVASSGQVHPTPALIADAYFGEYGAQQAWNPGEHAEKVVLLPITDARPIDSHPTPKILAIIHCYYTDIAADILEDLRQIDVEFQLLLTTDKEEKRKILVDELAGLGLKGEVVVCPNRGRDVAPLIVEGAKRVNSFDILLHLHTKKSPHDSVYAGWEKFLRTNLVGDTKNVLSILELLEHFGMVYSDHAESVRNLRNWGYDFPAAKRLLERMGISISALTLLDFPTGTMFWARREALEPLFSLGLEYDDFDEEAAQVDGTLAHAIERSLLYIVEGRGFAHQKVIARENVSVLSSAFVTLRRGDLSGFARKVRARLLGSNGPSSTVFGDIDEIYQVFAGRSELRAPRINVLIPTLRPEKIFGGVSTALQIADRLRKDAGNATDVRVIVTSDTVNSDSVGVARSVFGASVNLSEPNADDNGISVVPLFDRRNVPISLRAGDVFVATAWWTADLAFRLIDQQKSMGMKHAPVIYLVQDFEPGFYQWSARYAIAESTYQRGSETIAIINSEELASFFSTRFEFAQTFCLPYSLNSVLKQRLKPTIKRKIVLAYGRPDVPRNGLELIVEGLRLWQAQDPSENCRFRVLFVGQAFPRSLITGLENADVLGKLGLDEYADLLNEAAIGLSIMLSPHPSYPPLEMASAGCITITNRFGERDPSIRSPNIIAIEPVTPSEIAAAMRQAVSRTDFDRAVDPTEVYSPTSIAPTPDYRKILALVGIKGGSERGET